ncbi:MAG: large conductance mechanosensitive channel protein MscL [Clostridia bacterium]|nr:large conductance mechanosensitive channel protein MscL [Clostridia bacterium]MBO7177951.1 large conductance mechanosensitive channel protein MscL [Clostridia bacterium]
MFKRKNKEKKERKGFVKEFAEFINRGSIIDMAVGVIVGGAFKDIVNRLVDSIIMPILGLIIKTDLTEVKTLVTQPDGTVVEILWGTFIQACLDFLLIALVIFVAIKIFGVIRKTIQKANEVVKKTVDSVVDSIEDKFSKDEEKEDAEVKEVEVTEVATEETQTTENK